MNDELSGGVIDESNFGLLSVAALSKKISNGISIEELYKEAERKFDTLIELVSDKYNDKTGIASFGYSLDELRKMSLFVLDRLIADSISNPYMTLCVSDKASLEEIKRRRNKLLYIFHPDRNPDELSNSTNTKKINEAYALIESNKCLGTSNIKLRYFRTKQQPYHFNRSKINIVYLIIAIFIIVYLSMVIIINY
ncbi:hypothetical protein C4544_01790 [candidate division WS5 bacterium]|uniref:J domain-containing protein n=1 Tax=candidate division WS5 bacterium TaxID=2093353 RepID=A0A419DFF2_9BACT|nr:MAG: hypothetical protein C4544_01790 [candidate division WS5 bacterium]